MGKALATFDYDGLDKGKLNYYVGQFIKAMNHYADSGMQVGKVISEAHAEFASAGKEGRFSEWVETVLTCSRQTAYNYMWAYERFGGVKTVLQFDQAAMYKLASPNAPPAAVKEAIKLSEKGERIDGIKAKELLDKHSDKPKPSPKPSPKPEPAKPSGPCPHGGEHDYDDEACKRCHDPKPVMEISGGATFDTAEIDAVSENQAKAFAAKVRQQNSAIESFARTLMAAFDRPPSDPWLDDSRLGIARDQIKSACSTIRLAKAHDKECPKCDGAGSIAGKACQTCRGCGYLPKASYEAAGGQ